MNRLEFLTTMRTTLENGGLSSDDINDALTYYEEVFLDAGVSKESETAESLGDPVEIAKGILADSGIAPNDSYTQNFNNNNTNNNYQNAPQNQSVSSGSTAVKILLLILLFPVWFPVFATVSALLFSALVTVLALFFAFAAAGIGLIFEGIPTLFTVPPAGILMLGLGLFFTGSVLALFKTCFKKVVPGIGKAIAGTARFIGKLFGKRDVSNG